MYFAVTVLALLSCIGNAQEVAMGDVDSDGHIGARTIENTPSMVSGADNFFLPDPMNSHDWLQPGVVLNTLRAEWKMKNPAKVASLEASLKPIFLALPKESSGQVSSAAARYALHRYFSQTYGWTIKGLQPAGAIWASGMAVTPDVKQISKYILPAHLEMLIAKMSSLTDFDLQSIVILAATIEHFVDSETLTTVYDVFTTLQLPVTGRRTEEEVSDIVDTYMMEHALGMNLDVSLLEDVKKAKAHLEKSHAGWPDLQAFAQDVKRKASPGRDWDFAEIVQLVKKLGESYVQFQRKDCSRVTDELMAKPSYHSGRVALSEVKSSHVAGRRSLLTEDKLQMEKLGASSNGELYIANYVNSQSMCLATASFHTACCMNECEGLLAQLEREAAAPTVEPGRLAKLMTALPGSGISESLLHQIPSLVEKDSGHVLLHGGALSAWMHEAFPLQCAAPQTDTFARVTNPRTPDEWMQTGGIQSQGLPILEMMKHLAKGLSRYTSIGKNEESRDNSPTKEVELCWCDGQGSFCKCEKTTVGHHMIPSADSASATNDDVASIRFQEALEVTPRRSILAAVFQLAALCSLMVSAGVAAKSALKAAIGSTDKVEKNSFLL
jgi:hypothetical protein